MPQSFQDTKSVVILLCLSVASDMERKLQAVGEWALQYQLLRKEPEEAQTFFKNHVYILHAQI